MANSKITKDRSIEEIEESYGKIKERKNFERIVIFWIFSLIIFIPFLSIHLSVLRIDSGTIKFGDGDFQSEKIWFRAPQNTQIILNTGGSYVRLNDMFLHFEVPRPKVELDYQGSYSFNTSDDTLFLITVSGREGTFRYSIYYDTNYYPISKFFVNSTGFCAVIMTISLLISKWKLNHAEE